MLKLIKLISKIPEWMYGRNVVLTFLFKLLIANTLIKSMRKASKRGVMYV
jgi:hypothetical protein